MRTNSISLPHLPFRYQKTNIISPKLPFVALVLGGWISSERVWINSALDSPPLANVPLKAGITWLNVIVQVLYQIQGSD